MPHGGAFAALDHHFCSPDSLPDLARAVVFELGGKLWSRLEVPPFAVVASSWAGASCVEVDTLDRGAAWGRRAFQDPR